MEYHSAPKKNGSLSLAATWRDLEGIVLREGSQAAKDRYPMNSLICGTSKAKSTKQKQTPRHREHVDGGRTGGVLGEKG